MLAYVVEYSVLNRQSFGRETWSANRYSHGQCTWEKACMILRTR